MDVETTTGKEEVAIVGESVSIDLFPHVSIDLFPQLFVMKIFMDTEKLNVPTNAHKPTSSMQHLLFFLSALTWAVGSCVACLKTAFCCGSSASSNFKGFSLTNR